MKPLIKVCGMREADNIRAVEALGIDWMGFIFWPKSKRYVSKLPEYMPVHAKRVGVFVDEDIEQVKRIADDFALDIIQLHGHESPDYIRSLFSQSSTLDSKPSIIKAFNIASAADIEATKPYEGIVDYFLFDTRCPLCGDTVAPNLGIAPLPGGTGQQFDWSILSAYDGSTPFLLSGGIGPDDVPRLRQAFALDGFPVEKCLGIDLNSRFETAPGLKDITALHRFLCSLSIP